MYNDTNIAVNPLAVLQPQKEPRRYTLSEYLRREERSNELHEYYDGHIVKLPPANAPHNIIMANIGTALYSASKQLNDDCIILMGKQLVYLRKQNYALYPDVLVIHDKLRYFDTNETLIINPILIVEVLSKGIKQLVRAVKFHEYKTLTSFKEHILVDKQKCFVQLSYRKELNSWQITDHTDINESINLKSIDCTISLADIYENIELKK